MEINNSKDVKPICCIYMIERIATGQKYIGQTNNFKRRMREHRYCKNNQHPSYLDNSIIKYGWDSFNVEIIEEVPCNKRILSDRERYWIKYYNTFHDSFHYNLTKGGEGNGNGVDHPSFKNYYRVIKEGKFKDGDIRWVLKKPGSKFVKSSRDKDGLEKLASQLNLGVISCEEVTNKDNYYRVCNYGKTCGNQKYALYNSNGEVITSSVDKKKLEDYAYQLNQKSIVESEIPMNKHDAKRGDSFRICKIGKDKNNNQRYVIRGLEGEFIKKSIHLGRLQSYLSKVEYFFSNPTVKLRVSPHSRSEDNNRYLLYVGNTFLESSKDEIKLKKRKRMFEEYKSLLQTNHKLPCNFGEIKKEV